MSISDDKTTIDTLKKKIVNFRDERGWREMEDPKDAALSLVLEAAELLEHFQWMTGEQVKNEARLYGPICDELADVLWWVLVVADDMGIDVSRAFEMKLKKNRKKWPAKLFSHDRSVAEKRRTYYRIKAQARGSHPLAENETSK